MLAFLLTLLLFLPSHAFAIPAHFTTVFFDDEGIVYAGVKNAATNALVVTMPFEKGEHTVIPLPADASNREVIGLITEKAKLFVLTSGSSFLLLHVYDRDRNRWAKLGKVSCPSFTKARLSAKKITFSCEVGKTKRGKSRVLQKSISYGKERLYRRGVWRFPEFLLRHKGRVAVLEGNAPHWNQLRLRTASGERTISVEELLERPSAP